MKTYKGLWIAIAIIFATGVVLTFIGAILGSSEIFSLIRKGFEALKGTLYW